MILQSQKPDTVLSQYNGSRLEAFAASDNQDEKWNIQISIDGGMTKTILVKTVLDVSNNFCLDDTLPFYTQPAGQSRSNIMLNAEPSLDSYQVPYISNTKTYPVFLLNFLFYRS